MIPEIGAVRLECPLCGRQGNAMWEAGAPGGPRKLDRLSAGFLSIDVGGPEGPRIVCQTCRVHAQERVAR